MSTVSVWETQGTTREQAHAHIHVAFISFRFGDSGALARPNITPSWLQDLPQSLPLRLQCPYSVAQASILAPRSNETWFRSPLSQPGSILRFHFRGAWVAQNGQISALLAHRARTERDASARFAKETEKETKKRERDLRGGWGGEETSG